ncbi:hypothetical protein [Nocardioides sp.]|uniref:hypothetical protein n=1 Tax=Nocardioides sp. TaxID=35761 RepID=UPI00286D1C6A|nr:hypothetical protein [Nocardioides sp.]
MTSAGSVRHGLLDADEPYAGEGRPEEPALLIGAVGRSTEAEEASLRLVETRRGSGRGVHRDLDEGHDLLLARVADHGVLPEV